MNRASAETVRYYAELAAAVGNGGTITVNMNDMQSIALDLLDAYREIDRLTPPPHERYVRCSTNIVEELGTPSAPVRLTVTEEPDGFYYFVATRYDCPEAA